MTDPAYADGGLRVEHHAWETGEWEMAYRAPAAALQPFVYPYCGYTERSSVTMDRREVPGILVPVIINLGEPLAVSAAAQPGQLEERDTPFVAGLHTAHSVVRTRNGQRGIQVNLSPIGARMVFGLPMHELANQVVDLEDTLGPGTRELVERLSACHDYAAQFDLLDAFLLRRIARGHGPSEPMAWAWAGIVRAGGNVDIAALSEQLGWSPRQLIAACREEFGLPPKLLARVVRFNRARNMLERAKRGTGHAEVAAACGYYDQAHLSREFREFAGTSAREYLGQRLPGGAGVAAAARP